MINYWLILLTMLSMQPFVVVQTGDQPQAEVSLTGNDKNPEPQILINETIIVTATKSERSVFETPRAVAVKDEKAYQQRSPVTALDALDDQIGIWTEVKTGTTSDPVIRGLSGANILALVDGNTVTTLWGEGGYATDDLYGKIDSEWIDRIEVVKGPSSVLYGSNCLGGVINFITKSSPFPFITAGFKMGLRGKVGYDSVSEGQRYNLELFGAIPKIKYLISGSYRDIGNSEGARGQSTLEPTSGEDQNFTVKLEVLPATNHLLTLNYQNTNRDNIHRYYRPTQQNFNDRDAYSLTYAIADISSFVTTLEGRLYYQDKQDTRTDAQNRKTGVAATKTLQAHLQAASATEHHHLTYGIQYQRDDGENPDDEQFTWTSWDTGDITKNAPDSRWQNAGIFIQDEWRAYPKLDVLTGLRFDTFDFKSYPDRYYYSGGGQDNDVDKMHTTTSALTGSLSLLYRLSEHYNLFSTISRGFRQFPPSFGVTQRGNGIMVPSELQEPATSIGGEIGIKQASPKVTGAITAYYTKFDDFPTLKPTMFQSQDWYDYDGDGVRDGDETTFTYKGGVEAYIYGIELDSRIQLQAISSRIDPQWYARLCGSYDYAQDITNNEPFRHGTPPRAILALGWLGSGPRLLWWEVTADVVGKWDRITDQQLTNDLGYRIDPQDASSPLVRSFGLPGYTVYDVRGGVTFSDYLQLSMAIENVTNKHFRRAHARMDDPGTNVRATLSFTY